MSQEKISFNKLSSGVSNISTKWLVVIALVFLFMSSCSYNPSSVSTRVFTPGIGASWQMVEGIYFKVPLLSKVEEYSQIITVAVTKDDAICNAALICIAPNPDGLIFADTYKVYMEYQMRFQLPITEEDMDRLHGDVKNQNNLLGNTIKPFALSLASDTASQMYGTDYAQGGRNNFRTLMGDQAENGMYVTKVEKVEIDNSNASEYAEDIKKGRQTVRQVVYITDDKGNRLRTPTSISAYGIRPMPNSLNVIADYPLDRLITYVDTKQANIARQIGEEENQKILREQTETQRLTGAKNLVVQTNELTIKNETARLNAQREAIEAEKVKNLAVINKQRELAEAEAGLGIQKAESEAAKYEADAIMARGLAEAKVEQAKYNAVNVEVLRIRAQENMALAMYKSGMKVEMPKYVNMGKDSSDGLTIMTNIKAMEQLSLDK